MTKKQKRTNGADSISGTSAAYFVGNDESLAQMLEDHDIRIRDFMVLSFVCLKHVTECLCVWA